MLPCQIAKNTYIFLIVTACSKILHKYILLYCNLLMDQVSSIGQSLPPHMVRSMDIGIRKQIQVWILIPLLAAQA